MTRIYLFIIVLIGIAFGASNCSKTDVYSTDKVTDYMNLTPGKYIIYRLDSTVKKPFDDTAFIVKSYQAKDVVDAQITDNIGRPSWRIIRYLRDLASTKETDWEVTHTYMITPVDNGVEVIDNNMRYIKLKLPYKDDNSWKGNSYLFTLVPITSNSPGDFEYLSDWDYTYENVGQPFKPLTTVVDTTLTVLQANDTTNDIHDLTIYSEIVYSKEVYGKGIGLIYKDLFHREFQPPRIPDFPQGYTIGYGIRLRMISHN